MCLSIVLRSAAFIPERWEPLTNFALLSGFLSNPNKLKHYTRRSAMNWIHLMATIVSVGLFIYLTVALLWPEKFS